MVVVQVVPVGTVLENRDECPDHTPGVLASVELGKLPFASHVYSLSVSSSIEFFWVVLYGLHDFPLQLRNRQRSRCSLVSWWRLDLF